MKKYRLTDEELTELLEASKPVCYLIVGGRKPESPAEKAQRVWD